QIHGIDVSKYQQRINWEAVKAMRAEDVKIGFVFIKATEGLGNMDQQFRRNWKYAREAGLPRGAYHFFIAPKSGAEQAENFIRRVELEKGDLPPVLDVEQTYG
ncbi:glycoside hydrolase family 25 protein, partial [Flavihumibacter sediminis]|nr:glycoside hydrolase family 25 protein [Flavihumibacter sediminis]